MISDKGVKFLNRSSDGYYFCKFCNKPHRISTSIVGSDHLVDHFDEEKTNDPLSTEYYFCGECGKWHRDTMRDHISYRLYIKLDPSLKGGQSTEPEFPNNTSLPEASYSSKKLMNVKEVTRHMTTGIAERQECVSLAFDRGLGKGMKIEKWVLTEMAARLIELRTDGRLDSVEGEHKYPIKKSRNYEHCDFWWRAGKNEHYLEVKTIQTRGDLPKVNEDLKKRNRLRDTDTFHHLSILLLRAPYMTDWVEQLKSIYQQSGLSLEADWSDMVGENISLQFMLFG